MPFTSAKGSRVLIGMLRDGVTRMLAQVIEGGDRLPRACWLAVVHRCILRRWSRSHGLTLKNECTLRVLSVDMLLPKNRGIDMAAGRKMLYEAGFSVLRRGDGQPVRLDLSYLTKPSAD